MRYLTPEQVLFIHARLIEETGGAHGIRDLGALLAAVARPQATFDGQDLYATLEHKGAALMLSLIQNHPFVDGNKRTGVVAVGIFLQSNHYRLEADSAALVEVALEIARSRYGLEEVAAWLGAHMKPV